jgi:hypothetical protein
VFERESFAQFEELTLLQTRGSELCHGIISPPQARHHLPEGMCLVALRHTEMAREIAALWVAVSSATESVLGHSPGDTFRVDVMDKLAAELQKMEDQRSRLEWPTMRVSNLLLGPLLGRARLVDHLDEAAGQLRVELATRWEVDAELEALWTSAV